MAQDDQSSAEYSYPVIVEHAKTLRTLLIDLENCPNHIQELQDSLRDYDKVIICYASTGAKIPLDWLMPLHETISAGHLQIHKMDSIGKNAADFGIFFFAGMLAQQLEGRQSSPLFRMIPTRIIWSACWRDRVTLFCAKAKKSLRPASSRWRTPLPVCRLSVTLPVVFACTASTWSDIAAIALRRKPRLETVSAPAWGRI